jgi:phosphopantetheinyl transferase (holo-ACP synthase)
VIKECSQITVNAVSFSQQQASVFYACLPCTAGHRADQIHLVSILREQLAGLTDDMPIQIVHDPLGKPRLLLGECEGPAISFSEGGGKIWAALCTDVPDIGIDAVGTDEFPQKYPFGRVFGVQELQQALSLTCGDLKKAAALLWSVKEAAVKALGCAFHLADPLQLCVDMSCAENDCFTVSLSGKALAKFPMMAGRGIAVHSLFQENIWLSIALLNSGPKSRK